MNRPSQSHKFCLVIGSIVVLLLILSIILVLKKSENSFKVNSEIEKVVANNGRLIQSVKLLGSKFTYVQAVGKNCGSCHTKTIYIFDKNNKKVFEMQADDPLLNFSTDDTFSIIEPIRKENEPLCCATAHQTRVFKSNDKTFVEVKNSL